MVKVKYRAFQFECSKSQGLQILGTGLPSMLAEEFGYEMHKYNMLVDRFGNHFEVTVEIRGDDLCFTHGWSEISNCCFDDGVRTTLVAPRTSAGYKAFYQTEHYFKL
ncbi:unnamed protein product [Trifolium pratense]|uniref:Uncharacterized protein n=1 Tax=Trifolium pratense TaxID=57577 RepID=A0ACB0LXP4_TRIPR|nr:unnamed protein product [Trifolium pratense]